MRVETDRGCLLYWPPHEGILYCPAGPVSFGVPVVVIGTKAEIKKATVVNRWGEYLGIRLVHSRYKVTTRVDKSAQSSPPLPPPGDFTVRPVSKVCRDCGAKIREVDAFGECVACAEKWAAKR